MSAFSPEIAAKAKLSKDLADKASSLHMAIHLNPMMVEVAVIDPESGQSLWLDQFHVLSESNEDLTGAVNFVKHTNWGDSVFRKTTISFDYPDFTLAPQGFILPGKEKELLEFNTQREADCPEVYMISEIGAGVIYDLPLVVQSLAERFPNARFFPSSGLFLKHAASVSIDQDAFHVLVQQGHMIVIAFHEGQVKLTNHYGVQSQDDVLYHVSNAAMRLGMHLEATKLSLYGAGANAELKKLLEVYIRDVHFWDKGSFEYFSVLIHSLCA